MLKIKDNVDLKELIKFGFEEDLEPTFLNIKRFEMFCENKRINFKEIYE